MRVLSRPLVGLFFMDTITDFYADLNEARSKRIISTKDLADLLHKTYDTIRMGIKRKSFTELEKKIITNNLLNISKNKTHEGTFAERLTFIMKQKKMSAYKLSCLTGLSQSNISFYKSGRNMPKSEAIVKLTQALDVDKLWLLNGEGEMNKSVTIKTINKMGTINERVKKIMEIYRLNATSLGAKLGTPNGMISQIISGRQSKPSFDLLVKISEAFPEISEKWLLKGEGEMLEIVSGVSMETGETQKISVFTDSKGELCWKSGIKAHKEQTNSGSTKENDLVNKPKDFTFTAKEAVSIFNERTAKLAKRQKERIYTDINSAAMQLKRDISVPNVEMPKGMKHELEQKGFTFEILHENVRIIW